MSDVERAGVELFADTSEFEQSMSGASTDLTSFGDIATSIGSGAMDLLGAGFDAVATVASGAFSLAMDAAAGGLSFLASGIQEGIGSAIEAEQQINSLNRVINNLGDDAPITSQQALDLASDFQTLAGGSDDAVLSIIDLGLKSQQISQDEFPNFIQASLDLGAVMGDNTRAAKLLAMAQDDPLAAYKQIERATGAYSTELENQIKQAMEAGNTAGALDLVMGALAETTGGAAAEKTQTLAGTIELFNNTISEAWETIGTAFLPVLHQIADVATTYIIPAITELATHAATFFSAMLEGGAEGPLGQFVAFIQANLPAIQETVNEVFGSLVQIGTDLGLLWSTELGPAIGEIFTILTEGGPTAQEAFTGALDAISAGVQGLADFIRDPLIPVIGQITDYIVENLPTWKQQAEDVFTAIGNAITWFNDNVVPVLIEKFTEISAWVAENWPTIQANIETAINTISQVVTDVMNALALFWAEHGEEVMTIIEGLWTGLETAFTTGIEVASEIITGALTTLQEFWDEWGDEITEIAEALFTGIGDVFDAFALAFEGDWRGFGEKLREAWDTLWTAISDALTKAIDSFLAIDWGGVGTSIAQGIADGLASGAQLISDAAMAAASAAFEAAKGFFGIESPSKLFRDDIAGPIMEGWAAGLLDNADMVSDALTSISDQLTGGISQNLERVSMPAVPMGGGVTYNNNVTQHITTGRYMSPPDMGTSAVQGLRVAMS